MSAQDYQINLPYGSTAQPYSTTHPHRGDDRPCPSGTPIIIDGQEIGLTGATGYVFGAHLHIQEWHDTASGDKYANTRKPQNAFRPGIVVNIDPVGTYPNNKNDGTQGDGSFGKFITIQTADGWNDTYCHLSRIDVAVGDIIGDKMEKFNSGDLYNKLYFTFGLAMAEKAKTANFEGYFSAQIGWDYKKATEEIEKSAQWAFMLEDSRKASSDPNYSKVGNIDGIGDVFKKG